MKTDAVCCDLLARVVCLFTVILLVGTGCSPSLSFSDYDSIPADDIYGDISLVDAQDLAPFPICLPTYIPEKIETVPRISYHADFGDPMESDIRLRYYGSDGKELLVEIRQRHRPGAATSEELDGQVRRFYERDLLAWQVGWSQVDEARERATIDVSKYQHDGIGGWLYEVIEPASLQANMIEWGNSPVAYQVYTRLTVEEASSIVRSIPDMSVCEADLSSD